MARLFNGFRSENSIRRDRPLTDDELRQVVPSVFSEDKHDSRSDRYTYIPTSHILTRLRKEGFEPFYACQQRVRDQGRIGHAKHLLRLRRHDQIIASEVSEIILLNSHDGSSSYQMIPGQFRSICSNGMVCGEVYGEIRVPHKGDIVSQVVEGAYDILNRFEAIEHSREEMKLILLDHREQVAFAETALEFRYDGQHIPVTADSVLQARRKADNPNDLWTVYQRTQENIIRGGLRGQTAKGSITKTRAINGIDGDIKNNRFLWSLAEKMKEIKS
ncbi:DUF932 domain-containing protein [Pantoea vagans]|uniref:DUF932 domain-containing protein n=1 Tax=Pantoea vagans TaxID=470934 RepID=UPI0023AFAC95|nr:DUF932 domain-containing protein [Pantoea vagans]MDE8558970.1 DUF932 domain-containing protein [Pantoea vagans]MDE8578975.1 DUF932 domain-containing protein [Pantoea vagans]